MKLTIKKLRDYKVGNDVFPLQKNMDADHGGIPHRFRRYKKLTLK